MSASRAPDVLVVGGGAVGVCCAFELARRGLAVTLLERGGELAWGCSAGNAGVISRSHFVPLANPATLKSGLRWLLKPDSPFYVRPRPSLLPWLARFALASKPDRVRAAAPVLLALTGASHALHAELAAAGLDTGLEHRGVLNVYETRAGLEAARREVAAARRLGLAPELLEGRAVQQLEPAVAGSSVGAVLYPEDSHCDPLRFVRAVGAAAVAAGATIRTRVEVLGFRRRENRVEAVSTTAGDIAAGRVVIASGAWTPRLVGSLGLFVPVEAGKGYHVDVEPAPGDPRLPVWFQESRVIATPLAGRLRLSGTLELSGLDESVSRLRVEAILRAARRGLSGLGDRRQLEVWRGLRPCTPDGLPIVGSPESCENLVLATGHAMLGLTLAPVTGRLVAEVVAGEPPSQDLAPLSPDRFQPLLGRE